MSMIGGAIIAGASLINGRRDRKAGDEAADAAQEAARMGVGELQKGIGILDQLAPAINEFASKGQDQFDKYQRMLGPIEDMVGDYYMNLNPDEYAAQGNQNAQQQYQGAMDQVNSQLAAQGIQNSGMNAQMGMQYGNQMAQTKAQNIMNAPHQVAQQQGEWLGYVSGREDNAYNQYNQGIGAQQNLANQYNNAYANMANMYTGQSAQNNQMAMNNYDNANNSVRSGLATGAYLGEKADWKW